MTQYLGIALMILTGHVCAAGLSTLDEMPAPARTAIVHAYLEDDDPDKYSEVFLEPAVIDKLPGAIVTLRVNNGRQVQQEEHRFFLAEQDARLCNVDGSVMRHAFGGQVVAEEQWQVAQPIGWDDNEVPNRNYSKETSPLDIIGTELCVAHFATFADDLQERTVALMKERERQGMENSAILQARHEADVATLLSCLRDREELDRTTDANNRRTHELVSKADRLAITFAGLEVQRSIIESYKASAASRNDFNRQIQAYRASVAEHDRNAQAFNRAVERHQTNMARSNAICAQSFSTSALREVCRGNTSEFCADNKAWR
jgi:hypothetical protein